MKLVGGNWVNWSGGVRCKPHALKAPNDEVELAAAIRQAEAAVRAPGSGHSFTPVHVTDGTLLDLGQFAGLRDVDAAASVATFGAATPLWMAGPLLFERGLGLKNMGDIDRQTLAGVVSTGTHGTGRTLRNFSAEVADVRLVLASGEVVRCSPSTPIATATIPPALSFSIRLPGPTRRRGSSARPPSSTAIFATSVTRSKT